MNRGLGMVLAGALVLAIGAFDLLIGIGDGELLDKVSVWSSLPPIVRAPLWLLTAFGAAKAVSKTTHPLKREYKEHVAADMNRDSEGPEPTTPEHHEKATREKVGR